MMEYDDERGSDSMSVSQEELLTVVSSRAIYLFIRVGY